jgi:uncharacterized protein (UPF0332 family)
MKKIKFIEQLFLEEKIELVEPSKDISKAYEIKSENNFEAGKLLLKNKFLEEATTIFYYSMYNKLTSLFYLFGIKCENHGAKIILLKELFNLDNQLISEAKTERINKQYFLDTKIEQTLVIDLMKKAEQFNNLLDFFIDNISQNKIDEIRDNLYEIYKLIKNNPTKKIMKELSYKDYNSFYEEI